MKIDCQVVLDVLPLYADGLISDTTREITDEHLQECESCRKALEQMNTEGICISAFSGDSEKRLKQGNKRRIFRQWLPVFTVLCLLMTLFCSLLVYCTVPVWLTAEEADVRTEETVVSLMRLSVGEKVHGRVIVAPNMAHPGKNYPMGICCYGYRLDWLHNEPEDISFVWGNEATLWYRGDLAAESDSLIHGDVANTMDEIVELEKNHGLYVFQNKTLIYVCWGSLCLGLVFLTVGTVFRKYKLVRIAALLFCCVTACIFVTDGRMLCAAYAYTETGFLYKYLAVVIMMLLYWADFSCILSLVRRKKH